MELLGKLENGLAGFYDKQLPHLPANGRAWLSQNIWWIILIIAVLNALGIFTLLGGALAFGSFLAASGGAFGAAIGGIGLTAVLISLAFSILQVVLLAMSISPLKSINKKGWDLVFLTIVIGLIAAVVGLVLSFNLAGLILAVLWAAIEAYFLFEIRSFFVSSTVHSTKK